MESDFVTRNHLDSIKSGVDPSTFELLNEYKNPPIDVTLKKASNLGGFASNDGMVVGNILGQIQGFLQNLGSKKSSEDSDGLQIKIGADVLKWIALLVIVGILIWIIWKLQTRRRSNPLNRRLKKLEKQLKKLNRSNPNGLELAKDNDNDDNDDYNDDNDVDGEDLD